MDCSGRIWWTEMYVSSRCFEYLADSSPLSQILLRSFVYLWAGIHRRASSNSSRLEKFASLKRFVCYFVDQRNVHLIVSRGLKRNERICGSQPATAFRTQTTLTLPSRPRISHAQSDIIGQARWTARYRSGFVGFETRWNSRLFVSRLANAQSR